MDTLYGSLSEAELAVARDTERTALAALSEEELEELHLRVRRLRDKYVSQYRRQAAARVTEAGARGAARPRNRRAAERAEVFERALARVSTALARAARQSAAQLRTERLAAAAEARSAPRAERAGATSRAGRASTLAADAPATDKRPPRKSTGRLKRDASTLAENKRRQARRDAR
ncbi:MAG TPA: hypothetical protein VH373_21090 [Jatrophihabitantaceae bacterium]